MIPTARPARESDVLVAVSPSVHPLTVVSTLVALVAAAVLVVRGAVGPLPGRPVALVLGIVLVVATVLAASVDRVAVRVRADRPERSFLAEVQRSRRYGHPLVLVGVRCSAEEGLDLVSRLRTTDLAWRSHGTTFVALPETDQRGADELLDRLGPLAASARVASFPEDALTVEGLIARATGQQSRES